MTTGTFTLIDRGAASVIRATSAGSAVRVTAAELQSATGWELKPQGFCKDDLCYPVPARTDIVNAVGVDLSAFAALIGRPLALDVDERAGYLGEAAAVRAAQLASLEAPDFSLPDLSGTMHTLSDYRGKKVLLAAYGSW